MILAAQAGGTAVQLALPGQVLHGRARGEQPHPGGRGLHLEGLLLSLSLLRVLFVCYYYC